MAYTLLDTAYETRYPNAQFAKNPFRKKKKPSLLRRTGRAARSAAGSVVGKTWAGRGVRAAGVLAGAGLLDYKTNMARAEGAGEGYKAAQERFMPQPKPKGNSKSSQIKSQKSFR